MVPGEVMFEACGTPAYVAPEVLKKKGYGKEVDVWSTGIILYTMLARALPFHSADKKRTFRLIKEAEADLTVEGFQEVSEDCKDLIRKMLDKDPDTRITVEQALEHPAIMKYKNYFEAIKRRYHPVID